MDEKSRLWKQLCKAVNRCHSDKSSQSWLKKNFELRTKAKTEANDNIAELERRVNVMIKNLNYEVARKSGLIIILGKTSRKTMWVNFSILTQKIMKCSQFLHASLNYVFLLESSPVLKKRTCWDQKKNNTVIATCLVLEILILLFIWIQNFILGVESDVQIMSLAEPLESSSSSNDVNQE